MLWINSVAIRPIEAWPGLFTTDRRHAPFAASWTTTVKDFESELKHLGALRHGASIQLAVNPADLLFAGGIRSNVLPAHPGVVLNIDSPKAGSMSLPCDTFLTWSDNLRALALSLRALRQLERYGVIRGHQQYRGFAA